MRKSHVGKSDSSRLLELRLAISALLCRPTLARWLVGSFARPALSLPTDELRSNTVTRPVAPSDTTLACVREIMLATLHGKSNQPTSGDHDASQQPPSRDISQARRASTAPIGPCFSVLLAVARWLHFRAFASTDSLESKYMSASLLRPNSSVSPALRGMSCGMEQLDGVDATSTKRAAMTSDDDEEDADRISTGAATRSRNEEQWRLRRHTRTGLSSESPSRIRVTVVVHSSRVAQCSSLGHSSKPHPVTRSNSTLAALLLCLRPDNSQSRVRSESRLRTLGCEH